MEPYLSMGLLKNSSKPIKGSGKDNENGFTDSATIKVISFLTSYAIFTGF